MCFEFYDNNYGSISSSTDKLTSNGHISEVFLGESSQSFYSQMLAVLSIEFCYLIPLQRHLKDGFRTSLVFHSFGHRGCLQNV